MLLLSEWQNEPQPCRRTDPVRITLQVIRRGISTFRPQKIHVCMDFSFWKERNLTISCQGQGSELNFFAVTKPTQESAQSIRRVMHWGHLHGAGAVHRALPARDNCKSPALPNRLIFEGFPWGKPWGSTAGPCACCSLGGVSSSIEKGDLDQPTTQMWALCVPTHGHIRKQAFA